MFKKITAVLLAAVMAGSSLLTLASCSREKEPVKEKRTNVYRGTEIALPDGIGYINSMACTGDAVYFYYAKTYTVTYNELGEEVERVSGYDFKDGLAEGWYQNTEDTYFVGECNLNDGTVIENLLNRDDTAENGSNAYMNQFFATSSGALFGMFSEWSYDEESGESTNTYSLRQIDVENGKFGDPVDIGASVKAAGIDTQNYYYINNIVGGDNDNIYLNIDSSIITIDPNGQFREKVELGPDGYVSMMAANAGKLYTVYSNNTGNSKAVIKVIENGTITDYSTDVLNSVIDNFYGVYGVYDNKIYYGTSTGINTYDITNDTVTEVLNYINSDIDSTSSNSMVILSDGRIVQTSADWSSVNPKTTLSILSRIPDEELSEEIIIRLGCIYSNYYLTKAVIRFNKQNTGVRITIKDYSQYNNEENEWNGASTQFNNDIVTGNLPDLVLIDSSIPVESYFQKGIFTDLYSLIDDPDNGINRSDYLENVFKACESNGKLYSMILSFSLNTLVAKSQYVGTKQGWTLEEMMNAINNMPEGMSAFLEYSRDNILRNFFNYSMDTFVDWESGNTYFDSEGFIKFIEFLATCPEKGYWENLYDVPEGGEYVYDEDKEKEYETNYQLRFYKDLALFQMAYISSFSGVSDTISQFVTNDVTFVGYPTNDENSNGATITPSTELAISSKTLAKKEAWSFIKFLLNDEEFNSRTWAFTPNIKKLEESKQATLDRVNSNSRYTMTEEDLQWYKDYYSEEYYEYMKQQNKPFDESTLDTTMEILKGATKVQRSDSALLEIITEELSAFFAGTKTAEETAKVIDSRARIYVSTNS